MTDTITGTGFCLNCNKEIEVTRSNDDLCPDEEWITCPECNYQEMGIVWAIPYSDSHQWYLRIKDALDRAGHCCTLCGSTEKLRIRSTTPTDLQIICSLCHTQEKTT